MIKKISEFSIALLTVTTLAACSYTSTPPTDAQYNTKISSDSASIEGYKKKIEILDKLENRETTLSRMTELLIDEWPALFQQPNEAELWKAYSTLTWHIRPDEQDRLKKEMSKHPEYLQYLELQKKGLLPAKSVSITNVESHRNNLGLGYIVKVNYKLTLKNGSSKEVYVELNADDSMETFNPRFNTIERGETLPEPKTEQEEWRRQFILRTLDYNITKKMTYEELLEILK